MWCQISIRGKMSDFVSVSLFALILVMKMKLRNFDFINYWNALLFFHQKNDVRFEYVPWKNVWFCFISLVCAYFCNKNLRFGFQNLLKYFNIFWPKILMLDFNLSHGKMSDFVSFLLCTLAFLNK